MADTVINGTSGNDVIHAGGGGAITLVVSASIAEGIWPNFNVLVNGSVVLADVTVTAARSSGATQSVTASVPAGTTVTSVGIQYTNDVQTTYSGTEDRNLYLSSVKLNGTELPVSSSTYFRTANSTTVEGQLAMVWGGTLTFSGPVVQSAGTAPEAASSSTGSPESIRWSSAGPVAATASATPRPGTWWAPPSWWAWSAWCSPTPSSRWT
jgi:hypothetical protein